MTQVGRLSLIAISGLLVLACAQPAEETPAVDHVEAIEPASHDDATVTVQGLVPNEDGKWEMDAHTRSVFTKMAASFDGGGLEGGERDAIKTAGGRIRGEIDELIRGCTMTGEAHDQLHAYLMAYIPAVDRMSQTGSVAHADTVGMLLELYPKYFE